MPKVTLRSKAITKGRLSYYLDHYPPLIHPKTGKTQRREYLKLYTFETPKTDAERFHNRETKKLLEHIRATRQIDQAIRKGSTLFIYDFKFDDLTKIAYNKLLQYWDSYPVKPKFYVINFEDANRSHRCNPLEPAGMHDITDATEASRTIMLGLNRDWAKKQGDFFVESAINFLTAIIWYLRKYKDGKYCTLPHVLELMQVEYDSLFAVLQEEEEIKMLINPFVSALLRKAAPQLEGQIGSSKIALARLSSPQLYYVLSGNDFTLDINDPQAPKIVCLGNNPLKIQSFGPVASLFATRALKVCNQKNKLKSVFIFDEYPTLAVDTIPARVSAVT